MHMSHRKLYLIHFVDPQNLLPDAASADARMRSAPDKPGNTPVVVCRHGWVADPLSRCNAGARIWAELSDAPRLSFALFVTRRRRCRGEELVRSAAAGGGGPENATKMGKRTVHEHHHFQWFILPAAYISFCRKWS
jgi:hypothetical protein